MPGLLKWNTNWSSGFQFLATSNPTSTLSSELSSEIKDVNHAYSSAKKNLQWFSQLCICPYNSPYISSIQENFNALLTIEDFFFLKKILKTHLKNSEKPWLDPLLGKWSLSSSFHRTQKWTRVLESNWPQVRSVILTSITSETLGKALNLSELHVLL